MYAVITKIAQFLFLYLFRFILACCLWDSYPIRVSDFIPNSSYDFVVVGSGPGGSVVAARLAETGAEVLLLEAGSTAPMDTVVAGVAGAQYDIENRWKFLSNPNSGIQEAFTTERGKLVVGRVLGGGSTINALAYTRGNSRDYDNWARLGNPGWDYESVLPYFKISENFSGVQTAETDKYHGRGGPLTVEPVRFDMPIVEAFFKAGSELGYKKIDESGPSQIGFAPSHYTMKDGLRASASEAFLRPNLHRANLHIRTEAMVRKIIFNYAKRAVGVSYDYKGKTHIVGIRKEVVVSAGAVMTPKLLMLSGVGPKEHLSEMNIPVVADLEGVGQNLQDHPAFNILSWEVRSGTTLSISSILGASELLQYLKDRTGAFSSPRFIVGAAWLHVGNESSTDGNEVDDPEWTDTELMFLAMSSGIDDGKFSQILHGLEMEAFAPIYGPLYGKESFSFIHYICRPKSRGWIELTSKDPYDDPFVKLNLIDHPDDVELYVKGIRHVFKIAETKAFQVEMGARYRSKPIRQCAKFVFDSDDYWKCHVRHCVITGIHYAGTARMGPSDDPWAVVTPRLRLRGVSGVRVVDGSIMPRVVTANTMATIYMIGEKGAALIKESWGYPVDSHK